jgi:hypothetical protein
MRNQSVLNRRSEHPKPDGSAVYQCGRWLAVPNHGTHTVSTTNVGLYWLEQLRIVVSQLVTGAYAQSGEFDGVILTPRSRDRGREVIATKNEWHRFAAHSHQANLRKLARRAPHSLDDRDGSHVFRGMFGIVLGTDARSFRQREYLKLHVDASTHVPVLAIEGKCLICGGRDRSRTGMANAEAF